MRVTKQKALALRVLAILLLTFSACVEDERQNGDEPATGAGTPQSITSSGGTQPPARPADLPPPATASRANSIDLAVGPDGLTLVDGLGRTRHLLFGGEAAPTIAALEHALGPAVRVDVPECRLGSAAWSNGLTVYISGSELVGWHLGRSTPRDQRLTTISGVGVGSGLVDLLSAYAAVPVEDSTLGVEYSAGAMAVIFDREGGEGKITEMWAGVTCLAR